MVNNATIVSCSSADIDTDRVFRVKSSSTMLFRSLDFEALMVLSLLTAFMIWFVHSSLEPDLGQLLVKVIVDRMFVPL